SCQKPSFRKVAGSLERRIQATKLLAAVSNKLVRLGWRVSGHPSRMIVPSLTIPLTIVDLQHLPASERNQMADCLAMEEVNNRFDLAQGLVIRMKLLKLADEDHVFLFTLHHIVCDAWSLGLLARDLQ